MRGSIGIELAIASSLILLALATSCKPSETSPAAGAAATATPTVESDQQKAQWIARERMRQTIGASAVERSDVEVRPSKVGWMVVFRDAEAACGDGPFWPGACRFGSTVYRDVYACVERDGWRIRRVGASQSPQSLGPENPCDDLPVGAATSTPAAPAEPQPAATPIPTSAISLPTGTLTSVLSRLDPALSHPAFTEFGRQYPDGSEQ